MSRRIHFSRLLDMLSGSALAGANTKVQKSALYKDFDTAKLDDGNLRKLIDANFPTFYIVDCDLITKEVIKAITTEYTKYIKENSEYTQSKIPDIEKAAPMLLQNILNIFGSEIPSKPFMPIYKKLDSLYNDLLNKMSNRSSYIGYRNAAASFSYDVRTLLKVEKAFNAIDANSIIASLPRNSRLVIGPSFNYTKDKVNGTINEVVAQFINLFDLSLSQSYDKNNKATGTLLTIGNLVNAGHTSATTESGNLIGINMPMAQEKQFLLSGSGKELGVESAIADLYLQSDYNIKFSQNFTEGATNLLNMQFSFVVSMPKEFNTNELRIGEVANIKKYIKDIILPTIQEQAKAKFAKGILNSSIVDLSASPSISDFITSLISGKLSGNKNNIQFVKTTTASATNKDISIKVLKNTNLVNKLKTSSSSINIKLPRLRTIKGQFYSIASLQTLINEMLPRQMKQNMGDGSAKAVLNYRTGRLANSPKVERMSVSREGMISAYYNYMRNPYGTFSTDGAQSSPISRDPKLLIAKSIREIAQTKVSNRMRAILV